MHLADAFIQSDLQKDLHSGYTIFLSVCVPWELNSANAMLCHWSTGLQCSSIQSAVSVQLQRALHKPSQGIGLLPRERLKFKYFLTTEAQFSFDILHKYSHNKIFWGPWKICENYKQILAVAVILTKKHTGRERGIAKNTHKIQKLKTQICHNYCRNTMEWL